MPKGVLYSDALKYQCGAEYFANPNFRAIAREHGIDDKTVGNWYNKGDNAFFQGYESARKMFDEKLISKMRKVTEQGLDLFLERIQDPATREKMSMREVTFAAGLFHDKSRVMDGKATSIGQSESSKKLDNILKRLENVETANRFPRVANR